MGDADRWDRIDRILQAALDRPAAERAEFVARECADDAQLREKVERLLRLADSDDSFLSPGGGAEGVDEALGGLPRGTDAGGATRAARRAPPAWIGPYRVLDRIGEGGFGEVFRAEQTRPVRRQVALKLLKPGMDSHAVLARFDAERQALALMDHPAIARIYDAGETDAGLPYFAMEYIAGEPITDWCDRMRATVPERLQLFARVCRGVQHAHSKGIIHRDLKPSNVLVTVTDGAPDPRIIDFGIAKAVAMPLTDSTLYTMPGQLIGTPAYMSPERIEHPAADSDIRSDVYSLGVLLYELLTGSLPFVSPPGAGLQATLRMVLETEAAPPSTRIGKRDADSAEIAARRRTDSGTLRRQLRGELDWITSRAMAREPSLRYETANALALDVERHLRDEPVEAGPPSTAYRLSKFARRHKVAFGALAAVLAGIVIAVGALAYALAESQRQRTAVESALDEAEAARASSDAVTDFLTGMLVSASPREVGRDVTVHEVLDRASEEIGEEMAGRPEVEARVRQTMGATYLELGELDAAEPQLQEALALSTEIHGPDHPATLSARLELGRLYQEQGRLDEAQRVFERLLEDDRRLLGDEHKETVEALNSLATAHTLRGHWAEADSLQSEALARGRVILGPDHDRTLAMISNLAALRRIRGDIASAESLSVEAIAGYERTVGLRDPDALSARANLATVYYVQGKYEQAASLLREVNAVRQEVLGPDHPDTLVGQGDLAVMLSAMGRLDESSALSEEVLAARRRTLGPEHPLTLQTMNNLAVVYGKADRFGEAEELLRSSLAIKERTLGPEHVDTITTRGNLGNVISRAGRPADGLGLLREAMETARRVVPEDHYQRTVLRQQLGSCLLQLGRYAEAETVLLEAHARYVDQVGEHHGRTRAVAGTLAELYEAWGRPDDAATWRARAGA